MATIRILESLEKNMFNISVYFGNNVGNRQKIFTFVKREYGFEKKS